MSKYVYDIEVHPNYMLVGFMNVKTRVKRQYETFNDPFTDLQIRCMRRIIKLYDLVGFNSHSYDDPILTLMLHGTRTHQIYRKSKYIIENKIKKWNVYKEINVHKIFDSIDLIDVAPGQASLKLYGARLNSKKIQDLPYDPHEDVTIDEAYETKLYNVNDLFLTLDLYNKLIPMLELREQIGEKYNIDVMSKSDAQIAESIFREELTKKGVTVKRGDTKKVKYKAPECIQYRTEHINDIVDRIEDTTIELGENGSPLLPKWLKDETIQIGNTTYNIGLGGLHSQEKSLVVIPKENEILSNVDVASYYPSLIIDLKLYPEQLTKTFLKVYANIKTTRLQAKVDAKDKSLSAKARKDAGVVNDVLKITLNGSFGKFGSKYSFLYSPDLLVAVTFTGQLYLLMLIEELEYNGYKVISSNTDGVEVLRSNDLSSKHGLERIVREWESKTNMVMEYGTYNALFARDVNNYIAIYPNGVAKAKGVYVDPEERKPILEKNVEYPIVFEAIRDYLSKNIPMEETLYKCKDVARFTSSRQVKGGAVYLNKELPNTDEYNNYISNQLKQNKALEKRNETYQKDLVLVDDDTKYLGKVVRWYYADGGKPIFYKTGNKVPKSDGARPMMDLTEHIPKDLDYDKYIQLCNEHLQDLGVIND